MHARFVTATVTVLAILSFAPMPLGAQTVPDGWEAPGTPHGHPDLQGVWANNSATPLERPEELADKAEFSDEEVAALREAASRQHESGGDAAFGDGVFQAALANVDEIQSFDGGTGNYSTAWMVERDFDNRTSLITDPPDGRLPPMTPEAQERQRAARAGRGRSPEGPEDTLAQIRCISYGVPRVGGLGAGYNSYYQIAQTPDHVAIYSEMIHDVRIIPLDGRPHVDEGIRQLHGDSRGRWVGDTLVVETRNFSPESNYRGSAENLHLTERYTRVGPDEIEYEITVEDETTWTRPWTAMVRLLRSEQPVFEYACHEGNYSLEGILAGARVEEQRAEADTSQR